MDASHNRGSGFGFWLHAAYWRWSGGWRCVYTVAIGTWVLARGHVQSVSIEVGSRFGGALPTSRIDGTTAAGRGPSARFALSPCRDVPAQSGHWGPADGMCVCW